MRKRLDRTFTRIIALLQKNARLSNKELAAQVGLAPSTCLERVRALHEGNVFKGFHAEVDPKVLGIHLQAMVAIRLGKHSFETMEAFKVHVMALPEVHTVYYMAGVNDFMLHVVVRDSNHLLELNLNHLSTRPEVAHIETALIFEYNRNPVLPSYLEEEELR